MWFYPDAVRSPGFLLLFVTKSFFFFPYCPGLCTHLQFQECEQSVGMLLRFEGDLVG